VGGTILNSLSSPNLHVDASVLGGGPAGTTCALRLAMLGYSVALIEKADFPRKHVGESLQAGILPLFELLGIRQDVERAGFLRPTSALIRWGEIIEERESLAEPGFQVDRSHFDQILLKAAESAGVHIYQPARLLKVDDTHEGRRNILVRTEKAGRICISCRFIVDASGRRAILGGHKRPTAPPSVAFYAYFRDTGITGSQTRIESGRSHWFWGAPLPDGSFNATVFLSAADFREGFLTKGSLNSYFASLMGSSLLLSNCLNGQQMGDLRVCDATCRADITPVDGNSFRCGEAAFSIDPLSSQGVQVSMGSAVHIAAAIHTIAQRPSDYEIARQFCESRQRQSINLHHAAAASLYAQGGERFQTKFWIERSTGATKIATDDATPSRITTSSLFRVAPDLRFEAVPIVNGNFIELTLGVSAPCFSEPVVFLDGVMIARLIQALGHRSRDFQKTIALWGNKIPAEQAARLVYSAVALKIIDIVDS